MTTKSRNPQPAAESPATFERDEKGRILRVTTHGAMAFRDHGVLPPDAGHVKVEIDQLVASYEADLGGRDELTAGQRELLDTLRTTAGMRRLVELHLAKQGLLTARGRVRASSHLLLALVDREQRLIKELGMKRVPRKVEQTLADWIDQQAEEEENDDAADEPQGEERW